ncbi:MAG: BatA domain-containing protein [Anaerolineales bacterium]
MQFLTPIGFLLAALVAPIILLYMLKLRRKQAQVSSTLLWERLLRDQQANAPWQKLKRNLLLFLQLLILAALVFACARPALQTPAVASGSVVVLLDASASMSASDVAPSRFETARQVVQTLIDGLSGDSRMTLILVSGTPHALAASETDHAVLKKALSAANPTQGSADWQSAFALAAGAAHGEQAVTTLIVSDGGLPAGLPALPGEVRYVPVGTAADNLAITALALRPSAKGPQLFAEVTNYAASDHAILLSIYLGDKLVDARQFNLKPGASQSLTLDDLSTAPGVYKAHISRPDDNAAPDAFPLDDTAFAVYQASSARRVLLVSKGNLFLEQLLAALPGIQPFRALPGKDGALQIPNEPFDLTVLDGVTPAQLPAGSLLFVNPVSNPLFQVGAPFKDMKNVQVRENPLTRFVDWSNVHILQAKTVQLPSWADALITADAGPLVFAGTVDSRRVAVVTFDLRESDLPLQVAYPILFSNLINDLVPPGAFDAAQPLHPGDSLSIAAQSGVDQVVVASPSNVAYTLTPGASGYTFTATDELGYYAVNFITKGVSKAEYFAVNLFDPAESDIRVRPTIQVGRAAVTSAAPQKIGQLELWPWLAGLALLALLIEWQMYHRRCIPFLSNLPFGFWGKTGGRL